ncbi:MAG: type I phosphomannose isomerase catalytic subunit [Bacteroides sp.]|jgi:mannose-6-phosphate isomerase|nr:type I phosphomannose isomerase catalytic subunit [Bacteroides sp.]
MHKLYPLKFQPVYKDKVWGGTRLKSLLGKDFSPLPNCGESWELFAFSKDSSVVRNGFLSGNTLPEVIEVYMGDLVGDKVFEQFGEEFPLLVKFIDTNDYLSVQVHPDDALGMKRHNSYGKTEMWYIIDAEPGAEIISGFNREVERETLRRHIEQNTLRDIMVAKPVKKGDVLYLPAGKVHAIGAGITLCEIQQASDVTYRLYDWDRPGTDGKPRELHIEQAMEAIDFSKAEEFTLDYEPVFNDRVSLVSDKHFTTKLLTFDRKIELDYYLVDSFVLLVCLEGGFTLSYPGGSEEVAKGDVVLVPADIRQVSYVPQTSCRVLETYIG